jgi:acid phosphatase type 7
VTGQTVTLFFTLIKKLFLFLCLSLHLWAKDPDVLFLSWTGDPTTTMVVQWHTSGTDSPSKLYYKRFHASDWIPLEGSHYRLYSSSVVLHQAEITGLNPDTEYLFHLEGGEDHLFRTLPKDLERPLRIVVGGDAYFSTELNVKMNREIARQSPDFAVVGGDIAYTEGLRRALRSRFWKIQRWEEFFQMWTKEMVTKEGRLIPMVPVIGNHDVKEGFDDPFRKEVLFYEYFAFPKKGVPFRQLKIGERIAFYLLDSGHTFPVGGAQTEWLEETLRANQKAQYHFPVYHIGAFPSETAYTHLGSCDVRKFWVPLFEKNGVKISFENDSHTFKRTYPILKGRVDPNGIRYLGDGSWGVYPEKPHRHWYLAKALQSNSYWLLTLDRDGCTIEGLDNEGTLLDQMHIGPN